MFAVRRPHLRVSDGDNRRNKCDICFSTVSAKLVVVLGMRLSLWAAAKLYAARTPTTTSLYV